MRIEKLILMAGATLMFGIVLVRYIEGKKEGMGGYGTLSGLYFNNKAKRCFKNPYDPDWWPGYCTTIGTVII